MENRNWVSWVLAVALVLAIIAAGASLMRIHSLNQEMTGLRSRNVRLSQEKAGVDTAGAELEKKLQDADALNNELAASLGENEQALAASREETAALSTQNDKLKAQVEALTAAGAVAQENAAQDQATG